MNYPITICGPCSVESEEQILTAAHALSNYSKLDALRGGIWKPRTRPNSFEGRGKVALKWLKQAGKAIQKPVATEVANIKHVEEALKHEIDILWIGARTTVNPFAVQEIADALKGTNIPVMIKNPVNPDLSLWIGAIERIQGAGINKIYAMVITTNGGHEGKHLGDANWAKNDPAAREVYAYSVIKYTVPIPVIAVVTKP